METTHNLARMLTDLANLHPSAAAIARLLEKHPDFLREPPLGVHITVNYRTESGKGLPLDVPANLHYVLWLKDMLCQLWRGEPNDTCLRDLEEVLLSGRPGLSSNLPFLQSWNAPPLSGIIGVDWKHRTFVYRPKTLLQQALHYLMQQSRKAKICGNPDCPAPYFVAPRSNARYCSEDCLQTVQRAAKRAWWDEKGQEWRASQRTKKNRRIRI